MSDLLLRGRVDMSEAKTALSDAAKSVRKYEQEIESAAQQTGRFQQTIGAQMREVRRLLTYLEANGQANSQAYRDAQRELAKLTDQMGDMSKAAHMMASDTVNLDIAKNSLTGLVTAMGALQSVTALTGTESETFNRVMKGLQTTLGLVTAAIVLMNLAQKEFIATMLANPYGIAIAGVAALAGAIIGFTSKQKEATQEVDKFNEALVKEMGNAVAEKAKIDALISIANNMNESYNTRIKAVNELNSKYPELHANINTETNALSYDIKAYNDLADAIRNAAMARAYDTKLTDLAQKKIDLEDQIEGLEKAREMNAAMQRAAEQRLVEADYSTGQAEAMYEPEDLRLAQEIANTHSEIEKIDAQILEIAHKSEQYRINGTRRTTTTTTSSKATPEFGSDEWLQMQDEDTVKRYWDWVYNGIMNEARNKPIKVKPIIIPEEEEEPEDPEFLKMMENYRFEQRKKQIDVENELNQSELQQQIDHYKQIYENEQLSYDERVAAYEAYLRKRDELAQKEAETNRIVNASLSSMFNSIGSAMTNLGDIAENDGLKAMGIVATAIATIIQGYAAASAQAAEAGPIAWAAFSLAGLAQVTAVISQLHNLSNFESGGIIEGATTIGDYNLARVNSGEMILNGSQQKRLFNILNGEGSIHNDNETQSKVIFRIAGQDLVGVMDSYNKKRNRVL